MNKKQASSEWIDISWPLSPRMTTYKDSKPISMIVSRTYDQHRVLEHDLCVNLHTGTHVDAPAHMIPKGKTVELLDPARGIGPCIILDFTHCQEVITSHDIAMYQHLITPYARVLCKTRNSQEEPTAFFNYKFVYLSQEAALLLAQLQVQLVGIDSLGIERNQTGHPTHRILFSHDILIVEGLRLGNIPAGKGELVLTWLCIEKAEAAPARALVRPLL